MPISVLAHCMMTSSNGNIFRVTCPLCGELTGPGEFPAQRPVTQSFDVYFDRRLNKQLSKQPWGWWIETPSWLLWLRCNGMLYRISKTLRHGKNGNLQTTFPHEYSWINKCVLGRNFYHNTESNFQYVSFGLGNGLAPNMWQTVISTDDDDPVARSVTSLKRKSTSIKFYMRLVIFLRSVIFLIFQHRQNICLLLNTTSIFDRCPRNSAAMTPVKYECDAKNLIGTLAGSKVMLTEKLTNEASVTSVPEKSSARIKVNIELHAYTVKCSCIQTKPNLNKNMRIPLWHIL